MEVIGKVMSPVDPGFPKGRGTNPKEGGGTPTYYSTKFSRKLHENESLGRIVPRAKFVDVDPPLDEAQG